MGDTAATERSAIARRAGLLAAGTLLSRILGAARDAVIAAVFQVAATDAFFVAFTIPNALRVLLGEGAVSGAFVPVFSEVREKEGMDRARLFLARLSGAFLLLLLAVTVVGVVAAPALVTAYAAGYRDDATLFDQTVLLTRIVFPYIFLMGAAALCTGALNAQKRFFAPAFAPALLNVALIAAALWLAEPMEGWGLPAVAALAVGAIVGGVLQVGAQLPALRGAGLSVVPRLGGGDPYVKKAFRLLVPLLAGLGVYQLNVMLARLLASFLPEGSQSYLYYGQRLVEIPQGMFALAIATAALPTLSEMAAREQKEEAKRIFRYGLRLSLFVSVPSTVALAVLAEPVVAVLFGRGQFEAAQVRETARSLVPMAAGIWAVASVRTVVPMFHAHNDTRTPVIGSAVNLLVFGVTSMTLMGPLEHVGLAIAISAAAVAQLLALVGLLRHRAGRLGLSEVAHSLVRVVVASGVMGVVVYLAATLGDWSRGGNDPRNIAVLTGAVVAGIVVYFVAAAALGAPELGTVLQRLKGRLRRRG